MVLAELLLPDTWWGVQLVVDGRISGIIHVHPIRMHLEAWASNLRIAQDALQAQSALGAHGVWRDVLKTLTAAVGLPAEVVEHKGRPVPVEASMTLPSAVDDCSPLNWRSARRRIAARPSTCWVISPNAALSTPTVPTE